jgi:hypothetical protein
VGTKLTVCLLLVEFLKLQTELALRRSWRWMDGVEMVLPAAVEVVSAAQADIISSCGAIAMMCDR